MSDNHCQPPLLQVLLRNLQRRSQESVKKIEVILKLNNRSKCWTYWTRICQRDQKAMIEMDRQSGTIRRARTKPSDDKEPGKPSDDREPKPSEQTEESNPMAGSRSLPSRPRSRSLPKRRSRCLPRRLRNPSPGGRRHP